MAMKGGTLRWPITIQQRGAATQDPNSGAITYGAWTTFAAPVFSDMTPIARRGSKAAWEAVIAQQTSAQRVVQFDIRYIPGIDETMRVLDYDGNAWDIKTIIDVDTRHRELWLICERGITEG
jgi:SPP1 family predicted phage head-tail adaptor